jgi:hypothetical protein
MRYQLNFLDENDRVIETRDQICTHDLSALRSARSIRSRYRIEICHAGRLIARLAAAVDPPNTETKGFKSRSVD